MATLVDQLIANSGSLSLAMLADVDHASVNVTAHGGLVGSPSPGAADHVLRAGWLAFGTELDADGTQVHGIYWREPHWLNFDQTLVAPDLEEYPSSHVRWWLSTGTQAHLFVAGSVHPVAPPNNALSPWDRNAATLSQWNIISVTPGGSVQTLWTYTIPANKVLYVATATVGLIRLTAPTTVGETFVELQAGGIDLLTAALKDGTIGKTDRDVLSGPGYYRAGQVLKADVFDSSTGGSVQAWSMLSGFLFDA